MSSTLKTSDRGAASDRQCAILLAAETAIFAIGQWRCGAHGLAPSREAVLLSSFLFRLILSWWVFADRRARRFAAPFEFEAFVFFAWPLLVPYYLYKTRGGRGLVLFAGIWVLDLIPFVAADIARAQA